MTLPPAIQETRYVRPRPLSELLAKFTEVLVYPSYRIQSDDIELIVLSLRAAIERHDELLDAGRFLLDLIDQVYGTDNEDMGLPDEADYRRHRAVIESAMRQVALTTVGSNDD